MNRQRGQTLLIALILLLGLSILTLGNLRSGLLLDNSLADARDYQAALGGATSAVNEALSDSPGDVNGDPMGAWFFRLKPAEAGAIEGFMDEEAYKALVD